MEISYVYVRCLALGFIICHIPLTLNNNNTIKEVTLCTQRTPPHHQWNHPVTKRQPNGNILRIWQIHIQSSSSYSLHYPHCEDVIRSYLSIIVVEGQSSGGKFHIANIITSSICSLFWWEVLLVSTLFLSLINHQELNNQHFNLYPKKETRPTLVMGDPVAFLRSADMSWVQSSSYSAGHILDSAATTIGIEKKVVAMGWKKM